VAGEEVESAESGTSVDRDASVQVLLAEYQFVSELIPFYRGVELRALGGTGLVLSGIAAAVAALEAAETPKVTAEATLLVLAAWIPTFLLLIEIMALTRLRRASLYIAKRLHPLAVELAQNHQLLRWELEPSKELFEDTLERREDQPAALSPMRFVTQRSLRAFASSSPLIVSIASVSVLLAGAGAIRGGELIFLLIGAPAAIIAVGLGSYGVAFSALHEGRLLGPSESRKGKRRLARRFRSR
jgi:hypothetical protein